MLREFHRELAFTESIKRARNAVEHACLRSHGERGERYKLTDWDADFVEARHCFCMATLGSADFRGNGWYISTRNIEASEKASPILTDYPNRRWLKVWAEATIMEVETDAEHKQRLENPDYEARIERLIILAVQAYGWNPLCQDSCRPDL